MKYKLEEEHEKNILNIISKIPSVLTECNENYYFGSNYYYSNDNFKYLNLETDKWEYGISIHNGKRNQINVIISEKGEIFSTNYEYENDEFDNSKVAISKMYYDEGSYFMDSTVKDLRVPYSIMEGVNTFIDALKELPVELS